MTVIFLLVAVVGWFGGYRYGRGPTANRGNSSGSTDEIIDAPKWLFYLCGAPEFPNYRKGYLIMTAVRVQLMSISLAIYAISIQFGNFTRQITLVGFALAVFLPYVISYYLSKQYRVEI